jgi:hypothetical protein
MVKEGVWGEREYGASRSRACWEAGRRTACAEGAVILTAVQSLPLACTEGASSENAELGLSAPRGGLGGRGSREGLGDLKFEI